MRGRPTDQEYHHVWPDSLKGSLVGAQCPKNEEHDVLALSSQAVWLQQLSAW